jgi:hypothetical protein
VTPGWAPELKTSSLGGIDPNTPHIARVYDYLLGGKTHFAVDRALAEAMLAVRPWLRLLARENRASRLLCGCSGFLASGLTSGVLADDVATEHRVLQSAVTGRLPCGYAQTRALPPFEGPSDGVFAGVPVPRALTFCGGAVALMKLGLFVVVLAYYDFQPASNRIVGARRSVALAGVLGLCFSLIVARPLQARESGDQQLSAQLAGICLTFTAIAFLFLLKVLVQRPEPI